MGGAAKVIDWNGTDLPEGVGEMLPTEVQNRVRAGMRSIAEGRGIPLAEVDARLRATIAASRER